MKLLLDTHAYIWWDSEPDKLSARDIPLRLPLADLLHDQQVKNGIQILPVTLDHVLALDQLPAFHKDPFDRLLLTQAEVEDMLIVSADPVFAQYTKKVVW